MQYGALTCILQAAALLLKPTLLGLKAYGGAAVPPR